MPFRTSCRRQSGALPVALPSAGWIEADETQRQRRRIKSTPSGDWLNLRRNLQRADPIGPVGFIARQSGRNAIIGVNNIHSSTRQRFTIAHELGHFFLHGDQGQQEVHIDRPQQFQVKLRGPASSQGVDNEEMEANLFAAELLMPARFLVRDFQGFDPTDENDETVADLAEKFGVSKQAMSIRLAYLGLLNQE